MNEGNNQNNNQEPVVLDAVQSNPQAFQKITSKKLEVVNNAAPVEKEKKKPAVNWKIKLIIFLCVLGICAFAYYKIIYPTYIKDYSSGIDKCNQTYTCNDLGNGYSSCTYYDNADRLQYVTCPNKNTTTTVQVKTDEDVSITADDANKILMNYLYSTKALYNYDEVFADNKLNINMLESSRDKYVFLTQWIYRTATSDKFTYTPSVDNPNIGTLEINYTYFKEYYSALFGSDFDTSVLNADELIENGNIYPIINTDVTLYDYMYREVSMTEVNGVITITADVLHDSDSNLMMEYYNDFTKDYNKSLVVSTVSITLVKNSYGTYDVTSISQ